MDLARSWEVFSRLPALKGEGTVLTESDDRLVFRMFILISSVVTAEATVDVGEETKLVDGTRECVPVVDVLLRFAVSARTYK
jgi:hypothetical protein